MKRLIKDKKGQGMVEYLIIVSIMAIGTMGMVRILSHNTQAKLAQVTNSLRGEGRVKTPRKLKQTDYSKKDMSNFFNGSRKR